MHYERKYLKTLKDRISSPRLYIQVLTGSWQTGKTTIVKQLTEQINIPFLYASADNVANTTNLWVEQQWETARIKLNILGVNEFVLIIDEIQKIKNWSEAVKALWDDVYRADFILQ